MDKIADKAVCRSVFLTTWHCIVLIGALNMLGPPSMITVILFYIFKFIR